MCLKEKYKILILIAIGIFVRFFVMSLGHNFDFESYCIVGEIAANFRSVYAETSRYNYGFIFFCLQGLLYKLAELNTSNMILTYRILLVAMFTLADLGIALILADRKSWKAAIIFFLNPISILITGYHNQFDNIAILIALLSTYYYNEGSEFNYKDIIFVLLIATSLIVKHIFFLLPIFLICKSNLSIKKRILYGFVPPIIFLFSFLPFALTNEAAMLGIIKNVFLYKSHNNAPLFLIIYKLINFPKSFYIVVFGLCMCVVAIVIRKWTYENSIMFYLVTMVCFSSAIANQYLVIPMAAICFFECGVWKKIYVTAMTLFLLLETSGLNLVSSEIIAQSKILTLLCNTYVRGGYILAATILFIIVIKIINKQKCVI